ncbi:glycosyltransferase family 4 protein [Vibrio chagasii]|uniref:glycosyltransferase family 4 protein n=1 Tax=Vibrio chagasii TaxID=170679 RepID=UPI004068A92A
MKIILIGGIPDSLINFRGELIKNLVSKGHEVICLSGTAEYSKVKKIEQLGCKFISISIERNGLNPVADIKMLIGLFKIYNKERPDVIFAYTIKPVIWGGVASFFFRNTKFYALITGLGFAFQGGGVKREIISKLVKILYKFSLVRSVAVIFQNKDNQKVFTDLEIVSKEKAFRVYGSGVSLSDFPYLAIPAMPKGNVKFLTIARLLNEKGLREYYLAAEIVKSKYPNASFSLLGPEDPSPDGIPVSEIMEWENAGVISYLGSTNDVRPYINECHVFVLASYHEGMPRTTLEAMSVGRPILTTDVPGCRETVVNGENGWLVEKANVEQLAERMIWFIENQEQWSVMGNKSHTIANEKFDVHKVNGEILKIMGLSDEKTV